MPVIYITNDPEALTLTVTAEFAAPVERVWNAYADPQQLERFWGPPGWPASFTSFDHRPGGFAQYHMTSPQGEKSSGRWEFLKIEEPHGFEVLDCFVDEAGEPIGGFPAMRMVFGFAEDGGATRMTCVTHFDSVEALQQSVEMGMVEGTRMAMAQIDAVLQDLREYAQGKGTRLELMDDTHVRITRLVNGPREVVWRAHMDPELTKQWMTGPDGWVMTEDVPADTVGKHYRTSWAPVGDTEGEPFGFEGDVLLIDEPRRAVTTEMMIGTDGPSTLNDLNLYEEDGATLITLLIEYPDKDTRDMILATGMIDGMEAGYDRLERTVLVP
ncbi:SRPBCC domain-containing protein [Microbacterium sp. NPDC057650]|uniref:SRPBCC family protein n=1 Tax=unclassified Microbacterium TaxID=2609290 RepID=UPI003671C91D